MSNNIVKAGLIIAFACATAISMTAYANPCQPIAEACMKEGYAKGEGVPEGKHLIKDCVQPVVEKSKTLSVSFSDEQLEACKTMMHEKMQNQ